MVLACVFALFVCAARNDAFAMGDKTPDARVRSYADIMKEQQLQREMDNTMRNIAEKKRKEAEAAMQNGATANGSAAAAPAAPAVTAPPEKRRKRWDSAEPTTK
jgi:splicing factor 3B subunit 1